MGHHQHHRRRNTPQQRVQGVGDGTSCINVGAGFQIHFFKRNTVHKKKRACKNNSFVYLWRASERGNTTFFFEQSNDETKPCRHRHANRQKNNRIKANRLHRELPRRPDEHSNPYSLSNPYSSSDRFLPRNSERNFIVVARKAYRAAALDEFEGRRMVSIRIKGQISCNIGNKTGVLESFEIKI